MKIRSLIPHLAALGVIAGCAWLTQWQIERAGEKRVITERWNDRAVVQLATLNQPFSLPQPVEGVGNWVPGRQILLDNRIRDRRSGVHVLTPLQTDNGKIFLVNRGWASWPARTAELPNPDIDKSGAEVGSPNRQSSIKGVLNNPPGTGVRLGGAEAVDGEQWPVLVTYFDQDVLSRLYGDTLQPAVIQLDSEHPAHLTGDAWNVVTFGPERHIGYAMTWASVALVVAGIWVVLTYRQVRRRKQ